MATPNCNKCGSLKTGSYVKESWCATCTGERRKLARARRRAERDLPEYGSGRDPKCKICRAVKEERYKDGSYCAACKLAIAKVAYAKKRDEAGITPKRVGRNPICKCGVTKENPKEAKCSKCTNERKRNARLKKKLENPNFMQEERERINKWYEEDKLHALKRRTREATARRIKVGLLIKQPCEVCRTNNNVQAHHDDYNDPMNVRWLCSWHHAEHHKNEKQ